MPAPFQCSSCGFATKVKDEFAGKRIKCPKCKTVGTVGKAGAPASQKAPKPAQDDSREDLLSINLEAFKDAEVAEGEVLDESQAVQKPKKKKKRKKGTPLPPQVKMAAIGFSLLSVLVLAALVYLGGPKAMEFFEDTEGDSGAAANAPANPAPVEQ